MPLAATRTSSIPTPATPDVCTAKVLVAGAEVPGTVQVLALSVARELNRIPSATLQVLDGDAAQGTFAVSNADYFVPGKQVEIKLGYRSQEDTVFKGLIIKHSLKIRQNGSFLLIDCRDEAVKMTAGQQSRYYEDQADSDILEDLLGRHQLAGTVAPTGAALPEVVQYEASDWDFMLCRAEANGLLVQVDDGRVTVARPDFSQAPVVTAAFGATLLELDAEIDARLQSAGVTALSWNPADQEIASAEATEPTITSTGNLAAPALAAVLGGGAAQLRHGGHLAAPELQAWADGHLLRERLAKVRGRVRFQGFAGVRPGHIIDLQGIGERLQGLALVAGVRHQLAGGNWETDVQFGLSPEPFAAVHHLRPLPAAGLLPAVGGLQLGVVTALSGDPAGANRVRVRLPLISAQEEGTWARLATLDAGNQRGTFFRPEIGDEVVVGFLQDDPRHPIVLGMCHSSQKPAPEPPTDANPTKGYVSREKLKLTFDDEKKIIVLETPGGNKLTLSDDAQAIKLEDQHQNRLTLDANGITLESSKNLVLKAAKDVQLTGMNLDFSAQLAFKAQGTGSAELSSGASTTLKGSATTVIQGGLVQIN